MAAMLFSWLLPYRVLIVWVYDRTHSLLVAVLMHMQIVIGQLVVFRGSRDSPPSSPAALRFGLSWER